MARAVLITGGNRGEVRSLLDRAKELIEERIGAVTKASAHYESEPWGFEAEQRFWNQVLEVETALEPEELLTATQSIIVDTGYLAMMDATCSMEVVTVPGVRNALFGGEGIFNTVVHGPGKIVLQTMPVNKVAGAIIPYIPVSSN